MLQLQIASSFQDLRLSLVERVIFSLLCERLLLYIYYMLFKQYRTSHAADEGRRERRFRVLFGFPGRDVGDIVFRL
jgi:hypothetical protein